MARLLYLAYAAGGGTLTNRAGASRKMFYSHAGRQ
jgi:hypothetical protein